jgi:hypothetical protein
MVGMGKRLWIVCVAVACGAAGCGKSSPTSPSGPGPSVQPTRIINVSGDLAFGNVEVCQSDTRVMRISNSGTAALTYTSLSAVGGTGTKGYSATPTSGTVAAGGSQDVTVRFAPTGLGFWSNVLTVVGDQTSGNNQINVSGTGVISRAIWTMSGTGNTVFNIPSTVAKVQIRADYPHSSSNFIVHINGGGFVNELVGYDFNEPEFNAIQLTNLTPCASDGVVEILHSSGVDWSFTELR